MWIYLINKHCFSFWKFVATNYFSSICQNRSVFSLTNDFQNSFGNLNYVVLVFLFLFTCASQSSSAQTNDNTIVKDGFLWEISKKGVEKKSYLLGTYHAEKTFGVGYAFLDSLPQYHKMMKYVDAVGFEFDFQDSLFVKWEMTKIKDYISGKYPSYACLSDSIQSYPTIFKDSIEYNYVENFIHDFKTQDCIPQKYMKLFRHEQLKPNFTIILIETYKNLFSLIQQNNDIKEYVSIDYGIYSYAKEIGKKMIYLDPLEYEINLEQMDDSLSCIIGDLQYQAHNLYDYCRIERGDSVITYYNDMEKLYQRGDIEEMYFKNFKMENHLREIHPEMKLFEPFMMELVFGRNMMWLPKIISNIQEKSCVFAVGALHLPGENGLISLLRKEGYTVKPIKINPRVVFGNMD